MPTVPRRRPSLMADASSRYPLGPILAQISLEPPIYGCHRADARRESIGESERWDALVVAMTPRVARMGSLPLPMSRYLPCLRRPGARDGLLHAPFLPLCAPRHPPLAWPVDVFYRVGGEALRCALAERVQAGLVRRLHRLRLHRLCLVRLLPIHRALCPGEGAPRVVGGAAEVVVGLVPRDCPCGLGCARFWG